MKEYLDILVVLVPFYAFTYWLAWFLHGCVSTYYDKKVLMQHRSITLDRCLHAQSTSSTTDVDESTKTIPRYEVPKRKRGRPKTRT